MTISADLYSLEERARIQAVFTSGWGIANVVGPVIGGFLVIHLSWRWVFLVNVPVGAVAVALLVPSYRDPPRRESGPTGFTSMLYAGFTCALVLLALEPSGLAPLWHLPLVAAAALAVAAFLGRERASAAPLVPRQLLASPVVRAALVGGVFTGAMLYLCAAYVPLWMTAHAHLDAVAAGIALVPLLAGWAFGSSFGVRVLVRHGMRASVGGGFAIAAAGAVALAVVVSDDLSVRWAYVALAAMGLGLGPAASTSLVASQSAAPWHQRGVVTSAVYATRMLGGAIAVAAFGAGRAEGAARFEGIAGVALAAAVALALLAPSDLAALRTAGEPGSASPA
jgi:MFS family permease